MNHLPAAYSPWLVALSFAVSLLTSYTAVDLAARIHLNQGRIRYAWLTGGAVATGSGIWCMHFVGMLAFRLPVPVRYHAPTVMLSLLAAILASFMALYEVTLPSLTVKHLVVGSLAMGGGIAEMHYIGMAAMRLPAMHHYNPTIAGLSVLLEVGISFAGLRLIFLLRDETHSIRRKLAIAGLLGLAIPTMHYTGMAAIHFIPISQPPNLSNSVDINALGLFIIFAVTGMVLSFTLLTSLVDRRISAQHILMEHERTMLRALIDNIPDCSTSRTPTVIFWLPTRSWRGHLVWPTQNC